MILYLYFTFSITLTSGNFVFSCSDRGKVSPLGGKLITVALPNYHNNAVGEHHVPGMCLILLFILMNDRGFTIKSVCDPLTGCYTQLFENYMLVKYNSPLMTVQVTCAYTASLRSLKCKCTISVSSYLWSMFFFSVAL